MKAGSESELNATKALKIKLPVQHVLLLHQNRLLTGKNLSQTVRTALTIYLKEVHDIELPEVEDLPPELREGEATADEDEEVEA